MRRISSKGDLDLITERREKREKITNDHVEFYTPTKAPESKDCHEVITQQREKREKSTDDVLEFCTPIKAPELDRNGSPRTIFSNHEFGYLCRNSSSKQRTETPQRRRVRSDGKYSLRTCIDQTNPYLGYFVFAAEDHPDRHSPDRKGRDFFQRYNLLSNAKLRARKDRKLNPLRGNILYS